MKKKLFFCFLFPFLGFSQSQIGQSIYGAVMNSVNGSSLAISDDGQIIAMGAPGMQNPSGIVTGSISVFEKSGNEWIPFGQTLFGNSENNYIGSRKSLAMSSNGNVIAFGVPSYSDFFEFAGQVKVMQFVNNSWVQLGNDINGNENEKFFGSNVSISENGYILAISGVLSIGFDSTGFVRVYEYASGVWSQLGSDLLGLNVNDNFGADIDISSSGDVLVVGAPFGLSLNEEETGNVRVFTYISGEWFQLGEVLYGEMPNDRFGDSVSISANGEIIAVGSPYSNENGIESGSVKVYQFDSNEWLQISDNILGEDVYNHFGTSISLSSDGNVLAVGAPHNDVHGNYNGSTWLNFGSVRIYKNVLGLWNQVGNDIDGINMQDYCGDAVVISGNGNSVIISSTGNNFDGTIWYAGQVRVFDLNYLLSTQDYVFDKIDVYPNPTSGIVHLNIQNDVNMNSIYIYDQIGKFVLQTNQKSIDLSKLSSGVYYLKIHTDRGTGIKKIILK